MEKRHKPFGVYEKVLKRPFDAILSFIALLVLSPIVIIISILVRIKLGAPILFTQNRPGKNEKVFKLYKFRTMTDKRDSNGNLLPDAERLTSFGSLLRKTSLDELPELFNILRGDMSIVGPRPLLARYLPYYTEEERARHTVRPGLTGLAQINGRNMVKWEHRLAFDIQYVNRITFWGDVKIILKTVGKVFKHEDIAVDTDTVESYLDVERAGRM